MSLAEASVTYECFKEEIHIVKTLAQFEGEITLGGFIAYNNGEAEGYLEGGEVTFIPFDNNGEDLPVTVMNGAGRFSRSGIEIASGAPSISLGCLSNYDFDVSAIPSDGSAAYVQVTIKDLVLRYRDGNFGTAKNEAVLIAVIGQE